MSFSIHIERAAAGNSGTGPVTSASAAGGQVWSWSGLPAGGADHPAGGAGHRGVSDTWFAAKASAKDRCEERRYTQASMPLRGTNPGSFSFGSLVSSDPLATCLPADHP